MGNKNININSKTTSKIVLTLLLLTKELRKLDLALTREKKRSVNSNKISLIQTQFACKRLCKFRSLHPYACSPAAISPLRTASRVA